MSKLPGMAWISAWRLRRAQQRALSADAQDPGDMGTAFGMEASLGLSRSDLPQPVAPAADAVGEKKVLLDSNWAIHRLNSRSVL